VVHVQVAHGTGRDVEDDLPVVGVARRHTHPGELGIDQQVRRAVVVDDPLVQGAYQVGTAGIHLGLLRLSACRAPQWTGWPGRPRGRPPWAYSPATAWRGVAVRCPAAAGAGGAAADSSPPAS